MSGFSIVVVRGGGTLAAVDLCGRDPHDLAAICERALVVARDLAVEGCPFGALIAPVRVDILDMHGRVVMSIAIDESLKPTPGGPKKDLR